MKFEIKTNNVPAVSKHLDKFIKLCQNEYNQQIGGAKANTVAKFYGLAHKVVRNVSPIKPPDLPELVMFHEKKDINTILLHNSMPIPKTMIRLGRVHKKMIKNLEGYLKSQGFDVEINYLGD